MARVALVTAFALSTAVLNGAARADALWFDPPLTTAIVQGQWYAGLGAVGGLYRPPDWKSTFERFSGTNPLGPQEFSARTFMIGPGGTLGYAFRDGTFPAWMGQRVRVSFSGMWWSGEKDTSQSHTYAAGDFIGIHTVDGRVFANAPIGGAFSHNERLRTEFNAYELALRLTADRPLTPDLTLIPSVGIFGGSSREKYTNTFNFTALAVGVNVSPGFVNERVRSNRIGTDLGLGLVWQATPILRFGVGARAGLQWVRSQLSASDCWDNSLVSACNQSPGTFAPVVAFATSTSSSRSTVGFRGSFGTNMTLDGGWIQAQLGGFFTFDSASPGVANPSSGVAGTPTGTNVGAAHIRFAGGYSAGGFFSVRVFLP